MVAKLACSCSDASASAEITVEASTSETYEGTLKRSAGVARVRAINEREGGGDTHDPTGYRVDAVMGSCSIRSSPQRTPTACLLPHICFGDANVLQHARVELREGVALRRLLAPVLEPRH
jgi:hypothetical protein